MSITSDSPKVVTGQGDFYVEEGCCMSCGVPQSIAPELVGWRDEKLPLCYWIRQPETAEEVDRAVKIIHAQELGCHRYAGKNPAILERLPHEDCDFLCLEMALSHRLTFGPSGVPVKLSLGASEKKDGILARMWRWVVRGGAGR